MNCSLNEVEALAKKATRGAGFSWGLAEEASKSTQWLCLHGFDGCSVLAKLLQTIDGTPLQEFTPEFDECAPIWRVQDKQLCPIHTGVGLTDRSDIIDIFSISLSHILEPTLLLFFIDTISKRMEVDIQMAWREGVVAFSAEGAYFRDECCSNESSRQFAISEKRGKLLPKKKRAETSKDTWATLEWFAHRTYAPATEQSRLSGAGSNLSDND